MRLSGFSLRDFGMTQKIKLSQNKFALIDDEDFERANQFKWTAHKRHHYWYAIRGVRINNYQKQYHLHHLILNISDSRRVDNIKLDGLDNRRENLRIATRSENVMNTAPRSKSGFKGVYQNGKCFTASANRHHLGTFDTAKEAAIAYNNFWKSIGITIGLNNVDDANIVPAKHIAGLNPYPGVYFHKVSKLWIGKKTFHGKSYCTKYYSSAEEAKTARDTMLEELHLTIVSQS